MDDIILPTAHIQTKQGYVSGFHLLHPPSLLFYFPLSLNRVGGGREKGADLQKFRSLSHPSLEPCTLLWLKTGRASVSFSQPFPPFNKEPCFISNQ